MNNLSIQRPTSIKYQFHVIYSNGETLFQDYGSKNEKNFGHIDLERVKEFWLVEGEGAPGKYGLDFVNDEFIIEGIRLKVNFPKPKKEETPKRLIYFRRIRQDFGGIVQTIVKHCIGFQSTIDGKNYQQLLFIGEDGKLELTQIK